jgi:hypothetical protein
MPIKIFLQAFFLAEGSLFEIYCVTFKVNIFFQKLAGVLKRCPTGCPNLKKCGIDKRPGGAALPADFPLKRLAVFHRKKPFLRGQKKRRKVNDGKGFDAHRCLLRTTS